MSVELESIIVGNTVLVDGSGVTQPVSGTLNVGNFPAVQPVNDNGGSLTVDGTVAVSNFPGASAGVATVTNVTVGTSATTLSASNASKTKMIIYNESGTLYVKLGSAASASSYSYRLTANATLEFSGYYGIVTGIKASGSTAVLVTEIGI